MKIQNRQGAAVFDILSIFAVVAAPVMPLPVIPQSTKETDFAMQAGFDAFGLPHQHHSTHQNSREQAKARVVTVATACD